MVGFETLVFRGFGLLKRKKSIQDDRLSIPNYQLASILRLPKKMGILVIMGMLHNAQYYAEVSGRASQNIQSYVRLSWTRVSNGRMEEGERAL